MPARPADLPDALVLLLPVRLEPVEGLLRERPRVVRRRQAPATRLVEGIDDLAVHVELELIRSAVSDANRLRTFVAREPGQLELGEPAFARDAVHDLHVVGGARDRAQQPVAPRARLLDVAGADECEERERRVAQPAVPVVPVPDAAEPLRQRGRRSGDDPACRRVRERLQREQRAAQGLVPATRVGAPARPLLPEGDRVGERRLRVDPPRDGLVRGEPGEDEGNAVALGDGERGERTQVAALERDRCVQCHRVRACDGDECAVDAPDPRDDRAVVEAERELHAHLDATADSLDDADEIRFGLARRHEVDEPNRAGVGLELGLEDERVAPVATARRAKLALGLQRPVPVLGVAEQRGEDGPGVEPRQAEPVDAAFSTDERGGLQVADEPVVLYSSGHDCANFVNSV